LIAGKIHSRYGKILAKLGEVENVVQITVAQEVYLGAEDIRRHAITSIQAKESTGETYKRGNIKHVASAPNNPPNTDTGRLVQSIGVNFEQSKMEAIVGTNLKYGRFLEVGTKKISPRPWLFPAFEAHKEKIRRTVQGALSKSIKKAAADG
jgi:HK97 gp10 family phage protein